MKENRFQDIYDVVKLIPVGKVSSYGAIANYLGSPSGARLVGWAMNALHGQPDVPAHRVVNKQGMLSGKNAFAGSNTMQERLEAEGLKIKDDFIVDFEKHFWDPSKALF